jgi:hypothetical protein
MSTEITGPHGSNDSEEDLFIVELDERLEFGVASIFHPEAPNYACSNPSSCGHKDNSGCANGYSC